MRQGENQGSGRIRKGLRAAAIAACGAFAGVSSADELFDFTHDPLNPATLNPPLVSGYTPAPFLRDDNAAQVSSYLAGQTVKAVKVDINPLALSPAAVTTVHGANNVRYTFLDYEGPTAITRTTATVAQIRASAMTGPAVNANTSWVGNFNLYPVPNDPTRPGGTITTVAESFQQLHSAQDYLASGVNMANEALYPGAPDMRTRAAPAGSPYASSAPNIRSGFMTLPITRLSLTTGRGSTTTATGCWTRTATRRPGSRS
jgi:hypothetical protein